MQVNFGEHTIGLHGIAADGTLEVSNPLRGTRERLTPGRSRRSSPGSECAPWRRRANRRNPAQALEPATR